jgi:hypothetical protein
MVRGFLTFVIGFIGGAGLMLALWPHPPVGVPNARSSDLRIFISDVYLARMVERRVSGINLPTVTDVRIASHPPTSLIMRVDLSIGPLSAPATLELAPVVESGQMQTRLVTTEVAGIPIPPQLAGFVVATINSRIAQLPGTGGQVTGVRILASGLEISVDYP